MSIDSHGRASLCDIAARICVNHSILDAVKEGFEVVLIEDATRALNADDYEEAKQEWKEKGVRLVASNKGLF